jgi:hypothetical protein
VKVVCKRLEEGLNPAQDDYPRSGTAHDRLSSAPPSSQRDYNKGLETDDYNRHYKGNVGEEMHHQETKDRTRQHIEGPAPDEAYEHAGQWEPSDRGTAPPQLDDLVTYGAMPAAFPDLRSAGQDGIADPFNSSPGTRSAQIAAAASGTESSGGMTDFLWSSLPVDVAANLRRQYESGKAIVMVEDANEQAEGILREHGGHAVERQGYMA